MKRFALMSLLGLVLAACSQNNANPDDNGQIPLPSGVSVVFPAAPDKAHLSLVNDADDHIVYQIDVPKGKTSIDVDSGKWKTQANIDTAQAVTTLLPTDAVGSTNSNGAKVAFFHWLMWVDTNSNGTRDAGETLNLMSHDRVAYADTAVSASFTTTAPKMQQTWNLVQGWSRAEHYVYLPSVPSDNTTFQRSLQSSGLQRYTLHEETPLTSM